MNRIIFLLFVFSIGLMNAQETDKSLLNVRGTAVVYAKPNEALINFSVITHANDIGEAKTKNSEISVKAINYLRRQKIEDKHIQTQYLNIGKNYRWERSPNVEKKFIATQTFQVCIADLEKLEEIISDLLQMEISNLGTPAFRTTELSKYKDEARKKAVANAKHKAHLYAGELDQEIGKAHRISEVHFTGGQRVAYANFAEDSAASPGAQDSFAPGQLEIKAEVDISFNLQ